MHGGGDEMEITNTFRAQNKHNQMNLVKTSLLEVLKTLVSLAPRLWHVRATDVTQTTCCTSELLKGRRDGGDPRLFRVMNTHARNESFVWRAAAVGPCG